MVFSFYLSIVFLISFNSLFFFSLSSLSMFRIFDLTYLTSDSNVWDFSRVVSVKFFFPGHTFLFLCMLCNSFLRIRYSEYYSWLTPEIKFSHSWGIADLCLLRACPFVPFPNYFLQSVYSFLCGHWSFCSVISVVSQWPDKDFLKCLAPKREKQKGVPVPLNLLLDAVVESCYSLREQKPRRMSAPAPQDSTLQSTLTELYNPKFGRQGPHCLPYHQPAAPRMWAAVPTAAAGLRKGGW